MPSDATEQATPKRISTMRLAMRAQGHEVCGVPSLAPGRHEHGTP